MSIKVTRSIDEPIRKDLSFQKRWNQDDKGLIISWEQGRKLAKDNPDLSQKAKDGDLIELAWRRGSWYYLAMWQGLRGEDLDIDTSGQIQMNYHYTDNNGKPAMTLIKFPESGTHPSQLKKLKNEGRVGELYFDHI